MTITPTAEQSECVEQFLTGETLRIGAFAGATKTTTLTLCARATTRPGTYVAFNRSIADDAATKFPDHVSCSTLHSLAMRSLRFRYSKSPLGNQKLTGSMNGGFLAKAMGYGTEQLSRFVTVPSRSWGRLVIDTIRRFCMSGRPTISEVDVPVEGAMSQLEPELITTLKRRVVQDAIKVWERMVDPKGDLPLGHDGYLKVWAMAAPQLAGDYVFCDEAQDTNGVVLELIRQQRGQVISVGDRYQQIYEWRGALNAMDMLPTQREARLTKSFRFGPDIANYATDILRELGEKLPVQGFEKIPSKIEAIKKPDIILCRTNATLLEKLMLSLDHGIKPYIIGGVSQMLQWIDATEMLMAGRTVDFPMEFFGFRNWQEVVTACEQEDSKELSNWVRIVKKYPPQTLRAALEDLPPHEQGAQLLLSTGHKAKGREWSKVRLASDFLRTSGDSNHVSPAELRLFYVAVTRASHVIEIPDQLTETLMNMREQAKEAAA